MYPQHRFVFTDVPEADITDRACIAALAEKHAIDLIVNCAAYTAVDRAESDAETAAKINVQGSEVLAGVARKVPYNAEEEMKQRGARYEKAWLPFVPKVVVDGRLVTGQNPQSAKATAEKVAALLG